MTRMQRLPVQVLCLPLASFYFAVIDAVERLVRY
jgi:hypothetical protein